MAAAVEGVPLQVRLELGHAALQWIADAGDVPLLHIKGAALDPRITSAGRQGNDVDVLVPASDADRMVALMQRHGWRLMNTFRYSSAFEHAATLRHDDFGWADVHRYFPGITLHPDSAFRRLWADRTERTFAGIPCAVPALDAQILIMMLHAARSPRSGRAREDIASSWDAADEGMRASVMELVRELRAEVGFAAALGDLDSYRDRRDHDLWAVVSRGGTRFAEWRARVKAAPDWRTGLRTALRSVRVNTEHLTLVLGRRPTVREVVVEFFARPARGVRETFGRR